jgi:hypothetical protein
VPALKPGARILINDHCLREPGQENAWDEQIIRSMDMVMLVLLNAQERTEEEYRQLFAQVDQGFVFKVCPTFHSVRLGSEESNQGSCRGFRGQGIVVWLSSKLCGSLTRLKCFAGHVC